MALGRLQHPNIVEITDFGIDGAEGGRPYIVMEFLEGRPLSDVCRDRGPLPLAQALPLLEQIAAAVDAAHEAGVLHRDLKPDNVFVCSESLESPSVKVLDFGLAKLLAEPDELTDSTLPVGEESLPGLTTTGSLMGTPLYTAPELLRGGQASRSSDIYSFGVLAYEILSGKPPFQGTLQEVLTGHLKVAPSPLPLPLKVWHALLATLRKDPTRRPGTAGGVVRRFQQGMIEVSKPISTAAGGAGHRKREQEPKYQKALSYVPAAFLFFFCLALVYVVSPMIYHGRFPLAGSTDVAEREKFGFNDIERACGDLSYLPNYLCLVNQGSEQIPGGARFVLKEDPAYFSHIYVGDGVLIDIEAKDRDSHRIHYTFSFGPPQGKVLVPGLYLGAINWSGWSSIELDDMGSRPGIVVNAPRSSTCNNRDEGKFRILKIQWEGGLKFVADFETNCGTTIGRIAYESNRSSTSSL